MSYTLPNASTADTNSQATIAAETTAAENAFVAQATVLINEAISNGIFMIQPFLPPLVTPTYVTDYFQPLGYTVTFPIIPVGEFNPAFVPGFPEVLPPGYIPPFSNPNRPLPGPPRIQISWVGA